MVQLRYLAASLTILCTLAVLPARAQESGTMEVQETPSVLLPGIYLEDARRPLAIGRPAPPAVLLPSTFSPLAKKGEEPISLDELVRNGKHRVTLVMYWAFWCDTWKDMTKVLNQMKPQLEQAGIQVVAVAVDASQQPVARQAFESRQIWWPVLIDKDGKAGEQWGVRRVPTLFLVDKTATVKLVWEGFPGKQTFWKETSKALGIPVPKIKTGK